MTLTVGYVGMGGGKYAAEQLRTLIESLGMKLVVISEWNDADIKFNLSTFLSEMKGFDILICPIDHYKFPYKGNNKLSQCMALGKPVVASPLQSYKEIIKQGENGFIADNFEQWKSILTLLRDDGNLRAKVGAAAYETVKDKFSVHTAAATLIEQFKSAEETIDIIIPNYNNTKYLCKTLESLKRNTKSPYVVHLVDSSSEDIAPALELLKGMPHTFHKMPARSCFSKQVNEGIKNSNNNLILVGNNDLLFTEAWDAPLREAIKKNPNSMVGPLSNCDKYWLHQHALVTKKGVSLEPGVHTLESFDETDFYDSQGLLTKDETLERDKLAFYCALFERKLVARIGLLDEVFQNGGEDFDFCYRAKKAGWRFFSVHKSFVFHFGGKTRKVSENENYELHHKEDDFNNARLKTKLNKSVLAFYLGQGWERWDERNLVEGGIGGSETAAIWMARELSKYGYQVKIFGDPHDQHMDSSGDDVEYLHWSKWDEYARSTYIDFLVSSRTVAPLHAFLHGYRKYVWVHDVFIHPDTNHNVALDKTNYYLVLSEWHKQFLHEHHRIPLEKIRITANGIDPTRYAKEVEKNPNQIFYSSSPDRGLDTLLYCTDFIKHYVPDLNVVVAYGFNNWEKAVRIRNNAGEIQQMEELKRALEKPYVKYVGRVDQKTLADIQLQSSGWFYPTRFHETFCITSAEAGWAKTPILASKHAGLITTVKDGGILLDGDAYTKEFRERFIEQGVKLLTDKKYNQEWSMRSYERMQRFTWKAVAAQWHKMFQDDVFEGLQ